MLIFQEVSFLCGVLALGNSSARPDPATAVRLQETPLILLGFDNDSAGEKAAETWEKWYSHCVRLTLPEGIKDPGEFHQSGGDLQEWIAAALPSPWRLPPPAKVVDVRGAEPEQPALEHQDVRPIPPDDPFQALAPPEIVNNELSAPDFTPPPPFDYSEPPPGVNGPEDFKIDGWNYKPIPDLEVITF